MLGALAFVEGKGAFWLRVLTAESLTEDVESNAGGMEDLEADSAGDTGHETESGNGRDGGNHGIRPDGKKLMLVSARKNRTCATSEETPDEVEDAEIE